MPVSQDAFLQAAEETLEKAAALPATQAIEALCAAIDDASRSRREALLLVLIGHALRDVRADRSVPA